MSVLKLAITSKRPTAYLTSNFETAGGKYAITQRIINYLTGLSTGTEGAASASAPPSIAISVQDNQVQASGTIAFSNVASANDTILINGVTFTAKASGATGNQWNVGADATACAANLAAAINASVTSLVASYVTAAAATGTVTITSAFYGLAGNQCTIAKGVDSGSVMTVSGARLTAGAEDASAQTLSF
jgi:phage tail sheath gpL-like